jgi:retinol dehydrogenase-14
LALAWVAHISFDRVIGLPYPRSVHQSNNTVLTFPRMEGTIVMVTGASDGIGRATALGLAKLGATVVMVCRDLQRGRAAQRSIKSASGNDAVELIIADLASQAAIRRLAADYSRTHTRLDVLVNNAGVNVKQRTVTADGIELNFAVNYLAPFLLTQLLIDTLKANAASRVINVASAAEQMGRIDFDDLMGTRRYSALRAYCQSKLAIVLFTYELARRLKASHITVNCLHPGVIRTKITQGMSGWGAVIALLGRPFAASPDRGAETILFLASSPVVQGVTGQYFQNKRAKKSSPRSYDAETGQRLWRISEDLTDVMTERIDTMSA